MLFFFFDIRSETVLERPKTSTTETLPTPTAFPGPPVSIRLLYG